MMAWDAPESLRQLREAVDTFDRPRVATLCAELIKRLRNDDTPYPERSAADILAQLRRKRHFTLLQQVADAFIQSGADRPVIRRQYSQALLDKGNLAASVAVLQRLVDDTADLPGENAEARGLLGRAYKQMYLAAGPGAPARRRLYMDRAVTSYSDVYRESGNLWHGINVSALLTRAARDSVAVSSFADSGEAARVIAAEVLDRIEAMGDGANSWDRATAVEACVALDRAEDALTWLDSYLQAPDTDAFQLASMLRQLTEVWQLNADADPGARLVPVLQATLLQRQGGEELLVGRPTLTGGPCSASTGGPASRRSSAPIDSTTSPGSVPRWNAAARSGASKTPSRAGSAPASWSPGPASTRPCPRRCS